MAESFKEEGGYDCLLVGEVEKNVHCTFCLQIFKDPYQLACCQNHFCRSCVEKLNKEGVLKCPICRRGHSQKLLATPSVKMKELVDSLWVYCRYRDSGCPWNGELRFLQAHLDPSLPIPNAGCPFREVKCPHKCGKKMHRWQVQRHLTDECPKQPLVLRVSELEHAMATRVKVSDTGSDTQKKRELELLQRQFSSIKKQLKEEIESVKDNSSADCLRLREKLNAQETKLRELKIAVDRVRTVHQNVEQLQDSLQLVKQQISSVSQGDRETKTVVKTVVQPATNCSCPKLKKQLDSSVGELHMELDQVREEVSAVKNRLSNFKVSSTTSEPAPPPPQPKTRITGGAGLKRELDQLKKRFEQEIERNKQELFQERSSMFRERLELQHRLSALQPQKISDGFPSAISLPAVLMTHRDLWGLYDIQDITSMLKKIQRRHSLVESCVAGVLVVLFLAFLLHASYSTSAGSVLKECASNRNMISKLKNRVIKLENLKNNIYVMEQTISRYKLLLKSIQVSNDVLGERLHSLSDLMDKRLALPVTSLILPSRGAVSNGVCSIPSSQLSSTPSPSPTQSDHQQSIDTHSSPVKHSRYSEIKTLPPAPAIFRGPPSVVMAPIVTNSPHYSMAPLIRRVWEFMRLLPPLEFVMEDIGSFVKTGSIWRSENFYSTKLGYTISLEATVDQLGPNGDDDTFLSVYAYLMKGHHDDELKWPFAGYMVLQLLNKDGDYFHYEQHIKFDGVSEGCARVLEGERSKVGIGLERFASLADIKRGSIGARYWSEDDDSIKLRVVEVIHP